MRLVTTTTKVFKFDELTDNAKDNAVQELYDINVDHEWWEFIYEDAAEVGLTIKEFDLDRGAYVKAEFSGSPLDTAKKIKENHGDTTETYHDAINFLSAYDALTEDEKEDFSFDSDLSEEFLKSLCEDYRIMLQHEYDYSTSREAIIETINANDYEFTEKGQIF